MLTTYLQYCTRGDSSPQGKPRVYFCCHPEDFQRFFRQIADEILGLQNCAVYYYLPDAEVPPEERELDLGQMNLVVIPVTSRLLYHDSQAMADVAFALERHIPVLPLMQEEHLEETYNQKFSGLHFLNKNDHDPTALPYQEKLKKYLESVLIGDELAKQIREAFDAYIFLSYRKKDRKYAQELMRLIHKNDFSRDIAIWYDEFLTPGEEFSKAIEKALEKSKLFTLVVTENLLEPGNYVMTTEFPMARDSGKPILPAQMSAVDPEELANDYRDIPPCADAHDEPLLRQALLNALETVAKRENDEDPKHNFFIGLAYLGGVDVETDYERALALITKAAEAGLPEAMEKLVAMYQNGEGVARDYRKAISWQEKLVARYQMLFKKQNSEESYRKLRSAIWNLGDYRRAIGNLTGAEDAYQQMNALAVAQAEIFDTRQDLSISDNKLGHIAQDRGQLDKATEWYQQSLDITKILAGETETIEHRRCLSISYCNLGRIAQARGQLDDAANWYGQTLGVVMALAEETCTTEDWRELSVCYNDLGNIAEAREQLDVANAWFRFALNISEALAEENGTIEAWRDLSVCYLNLGRIAEVQQKLEEANNWYQQNLSICKTLAEETSTVNAQRDLSVSYQYLGRISEAQGKLDEARNWYWQALNIGKILAKETDTVLDRRNLAASFYDIGRILEACGRVAEARDWYWQFMNSFKNLAEETGTAENLRYLSFSYKTLGDIEKVCERLDEAVKWYRQSLDLSKTLAEKIGTVEERRSLCRLYDDLGNIAEARGQLDEATDWYWQSMEILKALVEKTGTVTARRDLSVCYGNLGRVAQVRGQLKEASDWLWKSLKVFKSLAEEIRTRHSLDDLAVTYFHLGILNGTNRELLQKSYAIFTQLVRAYPGVIRYQNNLEILEELLNQ